VDKNAAGKYPAPYAIVDCIQNGLENPQGDSRFENEREQFAKLAATDKFAALIGIFEGMTSLKNHGFGDPARPVKNVVVIGTGLVGVRIAQVSAKKGFRVVLKDRDDKSVGRGMEYAASNLRKKVQRRRMTVITPSSPCASIQTFHCGVPTVIFQHAPVCAHPFLYPTYTAIQIHDGRLQHRFWGVHSGISTHTEWTSS